MGFLFSDVGAQIYERAGFVLRPSFEWIFRPESGDPLESIDCILMEHLQRPIDGVYVWPTAEQLDWHLERERIYAEFLQKERPMGCGAAVGASPIFWAGLLRSNELVVLLLQAENLIAAEKLLRCATRVAYRAGLDRVRWWEYPVPFLPPSDFAGGIRMRRKKEQPMVLPLAEGIEAADWNWIPRAVWL